MTDQQAREFLQRLAVPAPTAPPPCPLCDGRHRLEQQCGGRARHIHAAGAARVRVSV